MKHHHRFFALRPGRLPVLFAFLLLFGSLDAGAQQWRWPEQGENLKVLPETITSRELRETMVGFSRALGVRCTHCHDDRKGRRLSEIDFASDFKDAKETARLMLKMVRAINDEHLAELGADRLTVTCATCHHGADRPRAIEDVLVETMDHSGPEAMVEQYHALRRQYFGGFTYDFSEWVLNNLGYVYLGSGKGEEALAFFKLNAEMYPESANVYDSLAEAYMAGGDRELAIAFYQKALTLNPKNPNAVAKLAELRGGE
ncbi:c-type cytochrome [Rhodocaloribacter sp.]